MNFKRFATFKVAISVIALGVWACSMHEGKGTFSSPIVVNENISLTISDSLVLVMSNDSRALAYYNTSILFDSIEFTHIQYLSSSQKDSFNLGTDSLLSLMDLNYTETIHEAYIKHLGYASLAFYKSKLLLQAQLRSSITNDPIYFQPHIANLVRDGYFNAVFTNLDEHRLRTNAVLAPFPGPVNAVYDGNESVEAGWWARWKCRRACNKLYVPHITKLTLIEDSYGLNYQQRMELQRLHTALGECKLSCDKL